jgi:glucose-6-phosphate 1-dehydrogenase
MTFFDFRLTIRPFLKGSEQDITNFLSKCVYFSGQYDSVESFVGLDHNLLEMEKNSLPNVTCTNRLFYFAIPPNVFIPTAHSIRNACCTKTGWNRLIVEKPFGHDLASALSMSNQLMAMWTETEVYRIDHYLGKEMVQNLIMFRFGNTFLEPLLNSNYVKAIRITFKEDFGTMGRGGYFDNYGIIRDIMQNHLMQVLTLVAMEAPVRVIGGDSANLIRDAKVNVLKAISPLTLDDVVLGQYVANGKGDVGYLDDPTVPSGSRTPTFAQAILHIHTPRWEGVPFIMKAGKALEQRKGEIRIQFKNSPAASFMFGGASIPRNELVLRLQPSEAMYLKVVLVRSGA